MDEQKFMDNNRQIEREPEVNTIKDYINLIRNNITPIVVISVVGLLVSILYAYKAPDIYKSTTSLKVSKPSGSILESPLMPEFQDFGSDRFIANEIEILKSYTVREKVAQALVDSFKTLGKRDSFSLILNKEFADDSKVSLKSIPAIAELLGKKVAIDQKRGLDIVEISVESTSPYEATLIANNYALAYNELNLQTSRQQLTNVKKFLADQKKEKQGELFRAEDSLKTYQQRGGIIALDEQAKNLISQLSDFESQMNAAGIELNVSEKNLSQYKETLQKQDPRIADYLASFAAEPYLKALQEEIAKLETKKDVALASGGAGANNASVVADYDARIKSLKSKVDDKISVYKAGIFASSPEEIKTLSQKIIEEEIKVQAARSTYQQLKSIVGGYDKEFSSLPKATIELAKLERQRQAYEKLYLLVEEKYQEALINEQSQPGNVQIVDHARRPLKPSKPNRMLIVVIGLVMGVGMGVGFAFVRNYFDNTIKTPEDIQNAGVNVLAWIPQIEGLGIDGNKEFEFIVARKPDSIPAEAFRALRTRVQFSRFDKNAIRTMLVTSSAPQEGKTTVSVNLAGSFAHAGKKTIIVDCDLRKPRMHNVFRANRYPGFTDYFFGQASFEEIVKASEIPNLYYITAGTIPPNPSEILGSQQMEEFLEKLRGEYDMILLDSPPIIAVTDSEILSRIVDASMLVTSANTTEIDLMKKSVELLRHERKTFIGVLLNNFSYRSGYGSYYKYYYYYSRPNDNGKREKKTSKV